MAVEHGVVDVHSHYISAPHLEALRAGGGPETDGILFPDFSVAESLDTMDTHGIAASVLSPVSPPPVFPDTASAVAVSRAINDGLAGIVSDHPDRFGAVAFLPMPDVDATLDQIAYATDELGLDGVHLFSSYGGRYLGHPDFTPVLAEIDRRGLTVDTHPTTPAGTEVVGMGWPGPALEFPFDTTRTAGDLVFGGAMERFPHIAWILPHGGGTLLQMMERTVRGVPIFHRQPWAQEKFPHMPHTQERARELFLRFFLDVTWNTQSPVLGALARIWGADHLLFGSDRPFPVPLAADLALLDESPDLDAAEKLLVRRETALRLFPTLAKRLG